MGKLNEQLIGAARVGNLEELRRLVQQGADLHAEDECALRLAASNGHFEVVKYLVEHGASPAAGINAAAMSGQIEVVERLLKAGASIDAAMERGSETVKDFCKAYRLREQLNQMTEKVQVNKKPTVRKI